MQRAVSGRADRRQTDGVMPRAGQAMSSTSCISGTPACAGAGSTGWSSSTIEQLCTCSPWVDGGRAACEQLRSCRSSRWCLRARTRPSPPASALGRSLLVAGDSEQQLAAPWCRNIDQLGILAPFARHSNPSPFTSASSGSTGTSTRSASTARGLPSHGAATAASGSSSTAAATGRWRSGRRR